MQREDKILRETNMAEYKNTAADAKRFFLTFISEYYEKRNYKDCIKIFHDDISWFGTGAHEICNGMEDALRLFSEEQASFDGKFKIVRHSTNVSTVTKGVYVIYSVIYLVEDGQYNTYLQEMQTRLSIVCQYEGSAFMVKHLHVSVPNTAQSNGEYVQKIADSSYNKVLEQTLEQRTKMLQKTAEELETLTNNICGGVQICKCDQQLSIIYLSDGFTKLSGYTSKLIEEKYHGSHTELVYKTDRDEFIQKCGEIIKNGSYGKPYSFEYRLVHKDGHHIWVLDNAIKLKSDDGDIFQCILTDITSQKELELALRLSEKRYGIAMAMSDIVMFEYNIVTRQLILYERDAELYNVGKIVENGVETFIAKGIIEPESVDAYKGMYDLIHAGAKTASCFVHAKDAMGNVHDYELQLNTVFDNDGRPVSAIGLRKNISRLRRLEKEREFAKTLVSGKRFLFEADVTNNIIVDISSYWQDILNITVGSSLSTAIDLICNIYIEPDYRETIRRRTSLKYISQKYEKGERLIVFSYKRKDELGEYSWFEGTINIIRDEPTEALHMRFYHTNINEKKIKEQRALEEQRLYENFTSRAKLAYEVNISKNLAIKGHENWEKAYGIKPSDNYSDMINAFAVCGIYAEDAQGFIDNFNAAHLVSEYKTGVRQLAYHYRKPTENGELRWVCCTLNLYEDPQSGDIKGYAYVEDIDEQKRAELSLKYKAEHDTMTGLYNKVTTQAIIEAFLADETYALKQHAFFIIDLDYFKTINDTFGHLFGDDVLRDVAARIKTIFRDDDIVGRIGGDEFVVLMKKVSSLEIAAQKAQEICSTLKISYRDTNASASISASVGIAVFPKCGVNYATLFAHADKALYSAKDSGKNNYAF